MLLLQWTLNEVCIVFKTQTNSNIVNVKLDHVSIKIDSLILRDALLIFDKFCTSVVAP